MSPASPAGPPGMVIVTGHLIVEDREAYLADCREVVTLGRSAAGCRDFALSPDLLDPRRVNVLEVWETQDAVDAFRGDGVSDDQAAVITHAEVSEHDVSATRSLS